MASDLPMEIAFTKVRIDCKALRGKRGKEAIELTPRELKVLSVLFRERGNAVSRDALLNEVWGVDYYGTTRTLDQLIVKLRQKIEEVPAEPRHLLTVHARISVRCLMVICWTSPNAVPTENSTVRSFDILLLVLCYEVTGQLAVFGG